ncbi:MAG: 1-acyl-sn-glycerol-3-phosphate acyltransferase [Planctomycetes bacterium]|nr:1-acyl-sn-glycerol-3-phosphate acyltransferase [Planctomycetota bacterium]
MVVFFRLRIFGRNNVPLEGPVILVSNHQSFLDPALVDAGLNRPVHYMARKSLFMRFAPFGRLISSLNAFPVERGRGDIKAVREVLRRLKSDNVVLAFPEGTRTHTGEIGDIKPGIFMIAVRSGVPVVPVAVEGAFDAWPRDSRFPRPGAVGVRFGARLRADEFGGDAEKMRRACRKAICNLQATLRATLKGSGE